MKHIAITALMLGILLVLTSCGPSGNTGGAPTRSWLGGTEGVTLDFEVDAPPPEVIAGDPFMVMVILNNAGEYTVAEGDYFVKLKGFSPTDFGTSNSELTVYPTEDLPGNELNSDSGEVIESYPVYVQIPAESELAYDIESGLSGNVEFPFRAEVCYTYKTMADAKLCIKEDLTDTRDTTVCAVSGPQAVTSSGAPVQITDFKEFSGGPNAVRFSFKVLGANTGGDISMRESSCSSETIDENRVYVTVDTGMNDLRCSGFLGGESSTEGYVKLTGGSRQITCVQGVSEDEKSDYVKIVQISAEYDYSIGQTKSVLIKPVIE